MGGSSSGRRQARARRARGGRSGGSGSRFQPRTPERGPATVSVDYSEHAITSGIGFDMLRDMGYQPGQALGATQVGSQSESTFVPVSDIHADSPIRAPRTLLTPEHSVQTSHTQRTEPIPITVPRTDPIPIVVRSGRHGLGSPGAALIHSKSLPPEMLPRSYGDTTPRHANTGGNRNSRRRSRLFDDEDLPRAMDNLAITRDPLRPRCAFNPEHIVRDLKAKQAHELRCPDNPNRPPKQSSFSSSTVQSFQTSRSFTPEFHMFQPSENDLSHTHHDNHHHHDDNDDDDDDDDDGSSSMHGGSAVMSDLSGEDVPSGQELSALDLVDENGDDNAIRVDDASADEGRLRVDDY